MNPNQSIKLPEKTRFNELSKGMKQFENFLISGSFKIADAIIAAAKAAYLSRKIKAKDYSPLLELNENEIKNLEIIGEYNYLNRLKRLANKTAFFYWYQALNV